MIRSILCDNRVHYLQSFNRLSRIIKSTLWDGHIDPLGWSNRPFTMIKPIIFFWPSTDDEFDYLEGCPIVDHHIWSARPSRYLGWPFIFLRVIMAELLYRFPLLHSPANESCRVHLVWIIIIRGSFVHWWGVDHDLSISPFLISDLKNEINPFYKSVCISFCVL